MLYIHVPFCHRKCTYCAFCSRPVGDAKWLEPYVEALLNEVRERHAEQSHPLRTIYFGGGTPSLLPIAMLAHIVDELQRWFDCSQVEEVTFEANPEDLTPDYLFDLRALHFFNRMSIGVQSLDDSQLRLIGRRHTAQQAIEAVGRAAECVDNISVDFMFGLPGGDQYLHKASFATLLAHPQVRHVSAYALGVEEGTAMAAMVEQGRVVLPSDDEVVSQYHALRCKLTHAGFEQYEVSNYAREGYYSRHNTRYWNRTPYLGLGPGAHSFDGKCRRWNIGDVATYCRGAEWGSERLTEADAYNELLMTTLRTVQGLPLSMVPVERREGLHRAMQAYVECGWIVFRDGCYKPTPDGLLHADGMAAALFVDF